MRASLQSRILKIIFDSVHRDIAARVDSDVKATCKTIERALIRMALAADVMPAVERAAEPERLRLIGKAREILAEIDIAGADVLRQRYDALPPAGEARTEALREVLRDAAGALGRHAQSGNTACRCADEIARNEIRFITELEQARRALEKVQDGPASAINDTFTQTDDLQHWLRRRFPEEANLRVTSARFLAGGYSMNTVLFEVKDTRLPAEMILRANRPINVTGAAACDEFPLLDLLWCAGLAVPQPIAVETQPTSLGRSFIIVNRLEGTAGDFFSGLGNSAEVGAPFMLALARELAKLHRLPMEMVADVVPRKDAPGIGGLRQQIEGLRTRLSKLAARPNPLVELAFDWLLRNVALGCGASGLVHGDIRMHNLLADKGCLSGIIDWEVAHVGHPAEDLGYCKAMVEQCLEWEQFVRAYLDHGGPGAGADPGAVAFFGLLNPAVRNTVFTSVPAGEFISGRNLSMNSAMIFADALPRLDEELACAMKFALEFAE
jgi:aminoglycoside phosphotransferase (APT) family kinase protein